MGPRRQGGPRGVHGFWIGVEDWGERKMSGGWSGRGTTGRFLDDRVFATGLEG